jgi:hypothetical protein
VRAKGWQVLFRPEGPRLAGAWSHGLHRSGARTQEAAEQPRRSWAVGDPGGQFRAGNYRVVPTCSSTQPADCRGQRARFGRPRDSAKVSRPECAEVLYVTLPPPWPAPVASLMRACRSRGRPPDATTKGYPGSFGGLLIVHGADSPGGRRIGRMDGVFHWITVRLSDIRRFAG